MIARRLAIRRAVARAWGWPDTPASAAAVDRVGAAGSGEPLVYDAEEWAAAAAVADPLDVEARDDRSARRDAGRYFTPTALADALVDALGPVDGPVLDPACGDGRLLVAYAARFGGRDRLFGVDIDPVAVEATRARLAIAYATPDAPWGPGARVVCADARLARAPGDVGGWAWPEEVAAGFSGVLGNPPWIAHAGRASRPLDPGVRAWLLTNEPAFAGYRTTHGVLLARAARWLRPGGRLALLVPTSVADLDGYAPVRAGVSRYAEVLGPLARFGDRAFPGVFQPSVVVVAEARPGVADPRPWPLEGDVADPFAGWPTLPAHLFVDAGIQTDRALRDAFTAAPTPGAWPVREGKDVTAWRAGPPRRWVDPARLTPRHRAGWDAIGVVVRQTARFPIAAPNDGAAFRNSLLGVRRDPAWPVPLVLALLNSAVVRAWHVARWRDAREGMPQVKVGHLRAIPAPPQLDTVRDRLIALAEARLAGEAGLDGEIDAVVRRAYGREP